MNRGPQGPAFTEITRSPPHAHALAAFRDSLHDELASGVAPPSLLQVFQGERRIADRVLRLRPAVPWPTWPRPEWFAYGADHVSRIRRVVRRTWTGCGFSIGRMSGKGGSRRYR